METDSQDSKQVVHRDFKSFILSKKFWMTVFGLAVLWLAYWREVNYLYSFAQYPQEMANLLIPAFIGLTRDFMVAFTAAVLGYLGIDGVVSWKHGTESILNQTASTITENLNKKEDNNINQNINYNEHIIEEGANGAPLVKPFSQLASQEDGIEEE